MVYFIIAQKTNRIKIGYSLNKSSTNKRFAQLQTENADTLTMLCMSEYITELEVHTKFAEQRHHGEWFDVTKELINYIKQLPMKTQVSRKLRGNPLNLKSKSKVEYESGPLVDRKPGQYHGAKHEVLFGPQERFTKLMESDEPKKVPNVLDDETLVKVLRNLKVNIYE